MRSLSIALLGGAVSTFALPTTPGECKPLSSLSFAYPPTTIKGLSAHVIFNNLTEPRGIRIDEQDNLLVIERLKGMVALTKRNDSTCVGWEKRLVISQADLEHGIEIGPIPGKKDKQYLYASSQETVYRWEYDPKNAAIVGNSTILVYNMTNPGNFDDSNPSKSFFFNLFMGCNLINGQIMLRVLYFCSPIPKGSPSILSLAVARPETQTMEQVC
jgi:hypothetical protein